MNKQELIGKYEYLNHNFFRRVDTSEVLRDLKQLDEPEKVKVPQFVADWIEECKNDDFHLFGAMEAISLNQKNWIIGLEKTTTWNFSPVLGLTATRSRKRSGIWLK